ncbi:MAG: TonB-dependent receptor [Gemmatimonadales bacterium]|nr:TonB-dependent receptor [Gemmatimonadales bacterium]
MPEGEDRIPGALENVVAGGVTWQPPLGDRGLFGAARVRHFGAYPLIEDNSVRATPTTVFNVLGGYQFGLVRLQLSVLNLFDTRASDIQYFYDSRLAGEPTAGVGDVHFHPVEPRQLRVALMWGL